LCHDVCRLVSRFQSRDLKMPRRMAAQNCKFQPRDGQSKKITTRTNKFKNPFSTATVVNKYNIRLFWLTSINSCYMFRLKLALIRSNPDGLLDNGYFSQNVRSKYQLIKVTWYFNNIHPIMPSHLKNICFTIKHNNVFIILKKRYTFRPYLRVIIRLYKYII
jgi:hypothetical protein